MADHPDVYADSFSISANQFSVTVTLSRVEPTGEPGVHEEPKEIVARLRVSPALAGQLAKALTQASAVTIGTPDQSETTKH